VDGFGFAGFHSRHTLFPIAYSRHCKPNVEKGGEKAAVGIKNLRNNGQGCHSNPKSPVSQILSRLIILEIARPEHPLT
jgi:hypothetical protein